MDIDRIAERIVVAQRFQEVETALNGVLNNLERIRLLERETIKLPTASTQFEVLIVLLKKLKQISGMYAARNKNKPELKELVRQAGWTYGASKKAEKLVNEFLAKRDNYYQQVKKLREGLNQQDESVTRELYDLFRRVEAGK